MVTANVVRTINHRHESAVEDFAMPKKAELPLAGSYSLFGMPFCKQSLEHADPPRPLERPLRKTPTSSMPQKEQLGRECIADVVS